MVSEKSVLLERIEHYCQTANIAESTFGFLAVNDGKLCGRLRGGKDVTLATAQKIQSYISQHTPDDVVSVLGKSVNGQNVSTLPHRRSNQSRSGSQGSTVRFVFTITDRNTSHLSTPAMRNGKLLSALLRNWRMFNPHHLLFDFLMPVRVMAL